MGVLNVEIVSMYYRDEYLAQFYLRHYSWADKITLITKALPLGIDNQAQADWYTEAYRNSKADWVILADIDELIHIDKKMLSEVPGNETVKEVSLYDIYPHVTEKHLDPELPIKGQRCHGYLMEPFFIKPIIARGSLDITFGEGRHGCIGKDVVMGKREFTGSHWRNCSLEYAIDTRINKRKNRFSQKDIEKGFALRDRESTEDLIRKEFSEHANDPKLW